jgi:HKD family nuclease
MKTTLIDNLSQNHTAMLNKAIIGANTLYIAVAFFKKSGLNQLIEPLKAAVKNNCNISIVVGQDFCLTEPVAIKELYYLIRDKNNCRFYMSPDGAANSIYHPKMYLALNGKIATLITGSANITKGGLSDNIELSLMLEGPENEPIIKSAVGWFDKILLNDKLIKVCELTINQYEAKYKIHSRHNKKAQKDIREEMSKINALNLSMVATYLNEYNSNSELQLSWQRKVRNYKKAKKILNEIISGDVKSRSDFIKLFDLLIGKEKSPGLWHSSGLARGRSSVEKKYKDVVKLINNIKLKLKLSPKDMYEYGCAEIDDILRFGVNKLTEIMNTYRPDKYSVLNKRSVVALKNLGFSLNDYPQTYNKDDYSQFNSILIELNKYCEFSDLSQVDHFLNFIYDKIKRSTNG